MKINYEQIVHNLRETFDSGKTRVIEFRKQQLKQLKRMYIENSKQFCQSLAHDLNKPTQESMIFEVNVLIDDVDFILNHIDQWAKTQTAPFSLATMFDKPRIYKDPYGVVLVMGAWNYPLQLPLVPVSGAIAAGNCVIIKPSEISTATADLISSLVPKYLDQDCYRVVCGGVPETTELLKQKFDYIFYTGSTRVGKIVRAAANDNLTPTTLELGGKSPTYIDNTVDMYLATKRVMWGKLINAGQTCVAPDYVICTREVRDKFIAAAQRIIPEWYGDDPQRCPDLCRIVNQAHFDRLTGYLKEGKVAMGGGFDATERWIEPTILIDMPLDSKVMTEEIFGPVLPIVTVESAQEAIRFIRSRGEPLSAYFFSRDSERQQSFIRDVRAGNMSINDVVIQFSLPGLPFGGVGPSGMGAYHGKYSFDTFTHQKGVLIRNYNPIAEIIGGLRFPPYSDRKISLLTMLLKPRRSLSIFSMKYLYYLTAFGLGALSFYAIQQASKDESHTWLRDRILSFSEHYLKK